MRTLTEIIEAIASGKIGEMDLTVEEEVLAGSFLHERTERPEMLAVVRDHAELLTRYLALEAQQRQPLEKLRQKRREYLEGDFEADPAVPLSRKPQKLTAPSWEL